VTGVDVLVIAIGLLSLLAIWTYLDWRQDDRYRRLERRAHRNLERTGGES
jgi:hypothetical protein